MGQSACGRWLDACDCNCAPEAPPHRGVMLLGPPGSGKSSHAPRLASEYCLLPVDPDACLKRERADAGWTPPSPFTPQSPTDKTGDPLLREDRQLCAAVARAIAANTATEGYVIDGFPRTVRQARLLDDALGPLLRATHVVLLGAADDVLAHRVCRRWVHRGSGRTYHEQLKPPSSLSTYISKHPGARLPVSAETMRDDETGEELVPRSPHSYDAAYTSMQRCRAELAEVERYYDTRRCGSRKCDGAQGIPRVFRVDVGQPVSYVYDEILRGQRRELTGPYHLPGVDPPHPPGSQPQPSLGSVGG